MANNNPHREHQQCPVSRGQIIKRLWAAHVDRCRREAAKPDLMAISDEDLARHNSLLELERAAEREKGPWIPFRKIETLFRRSFKNSEGQSCRASDYGYRAFRMEVKGEHTNQKRQPTKASLQIAALQPAVSLRRLDGGFAAGDRIRHDVSGPGVILSVARSETIFRLNTGLRSIRPKRAHHYLVKD
jgi:hypothetical protein